MHRLVVELPEFVLNRLAPTADEAALRLKELALIELFRRGEVSSGWAAEQLVMSKSDFIDLLARHEVPYFNLPAEELRQDLETLEKYHERQQASPSPIADR